MNMKSERVLIGMRSALSTMIVHARAVAKKRIVGAGGWEAGLGSLGEASRMSAVAVINTFMVFRIILTNAVKYVTNVEGYDRRIQSAINIQGKKMQRRAEFLLTRALRRARW